MHQQVLASIITIGDELLIGQTIDTNSAFIARELNSIGVWVHRRVAVGDQYEAIHYALREEEKLSDIILITGGLGPTADDITKPLLCDYFGGKLIVNERVQAHIIYLFEKVFHRKGPMLERNLKQAEVPDNCTVLFNERGTAPGMVFKKTIPSITGSIEKEPSPVRLYISLPGVPHEMKGLMSKEVIPLIKSEFQLPVILHKTIVTAGQGESLVAETLKDFEHSLPGHIKLAYLPNYGMLKLRLTALGSNKNDLEKEVESFSLQLKNLVTEIMVTDRDESLESVIGRILKEKNKTLGMAESCTGGYIAHLITSIPGSSSYFKGSVVSYNNELKEKLVGVDPETLSLFGAVSEKTVQEMAMGAVENLDVDYALAVSGIMGPDGGTETKPVGTVWIAAAGKENMETVQLHLRFDRQRNIEMTAAAALNFLRKYILNH